MKRSRKAVLFLLLVVALIPSLFSQRAKIEFKEEVMDFGERQDGEVLEHIFVFTNPGDVALQIFDLQPT